MMLRSQLQKAVQVGSLRHGFRHEITASRLKPMNVPVGLNKRKVARPEN